MSATSLERIKSFCSSVLTDLGAAMPVADMERLAARVHDALAVQARSYHTPEHVFAIAAGLNPVQSLAALFHDMVYDQVDGAFTAEIAAILAPYVDRQDGELVIAACARPDDVSLALTLEVFGHELGAPLPFAGRNELLSALVMNLELVGRVGIRELLKATACIEATIPFRERNERGETPAEALERRLCSVSPAFGLAMGLDEVREAVQWAVELSNHDVAGFADGDPARFLDRTWQLLPESNPCLRVRPACSIRDYRQALQKTRTFLASLAPEQVFARYRGFPPEDRYRMLLARTERNLDLARRYVDLRVLAVVVLEALASVAGGDVPSAWRMDSFAKGADGALALEDVLPRLPVCAAVATSDELYHLLAPVHDPQATVNHRYSPLALFIYEQVELSRFPQLFQAADQVCEGSLSAAQFLGLFPRELIAAIAESVAGLPVSDRGALRAYAAALRGGL